MKRKPLDSRNALSALRLSLALSLATLIPLLLYGSAPSWWSNRGVLVEQGVADDYAPANQGQLKNIAKAAVAEMDAKLSGGAGETLHQLIGSWSNPTSETNDYATVNLGQLKNVAKPFYDRLIAAGLVDFYPWLSAATAPDDFAVANIGQVKNLFGFEISAPNLLGDPVGDRVAAGQLSGNLALEAQVIWIWGDHFRSGTDFERNYPRRISQLSSISSVSAGERHLVALQSNGTVWTWGENGVGQLGDPTSGTRDVPVPVPNLAKVVSVKAGGLHTLALKDDGTVVAWGDNYYGQLGSGDTSPASIPTVVIGLTDVRKIAAGYQRSVAIKNDGTVWTWGYDHYNGHDIFSFFPSAVPDLTDVIDVAAGYEHTVAVKADGTVWAWGSNYANQIGNGNPRSMFQDVPFLVPNLSNISKVASSYDHTLALAADGTVWAWGNNFGGQLGDGTTAVRQFPVQVSGLTNVIAIATAYSCSLAMKADGTVWAWGDGATGTLPGVDPHLPQLIGLGLLDNNHNGMDDRWEMQFLGNLNQSGDADFDGDGISNRQEYLRGSDPTDYFDGITPIIEIAGGNNQIGEPGKFLSKPFKVRLRNQVGQLLVNAPVNFSIFGDSGALASTLNGPQQQILSVRTDANGEATAYHALPDAPGISTRTIASAGSTPASAFVAFRGVVKFSIPPNPAPSATPPDPNATPTPTPSPTATPIAPYRYAIIDLGKDLYPIRINNKGWILLQGPDAAGNWGYFRWKAGVLERLTYSGANSRFDASDMNDEGIVVGSFSREEPWVPDAENELEGGLTWAADRSEAVKTSAPVAAQTWAFRRYGTIRQSFFKTISNKNTVFGGVRTGGGYGFLFGIFDIINAYRWVNGSATQLSFGASNYVENPNHIFEVFVVSGETDDVTRANGDGHYIGSKFALLSVGFPPYLNGTLSGMIDGSGVGFDPVDINEAGIVAGSAGADMVVYSSPNSQTTISGASPLAINDHTRPAPSPVPQSSPASSPSPTPIPVPQILGWAGNAVALWERQEDGQTWHPFGLEEMIPSMDGWDYIEPYDMNDTGAIVGVGSYKDPSTPSAQGETHGFLLVPVELMVDGNRDGEMSFNDSTVHDADQTSEEKPYRFWVNDDDDGAGGELGEHVPPSAPDYADGTIQSVRDLEDFARLHVNVAGLEASLESGSIKAAFEWKEASNSPRIKIYRAPFAGTDYLTNGSKAASTLLFPFRDTLGEVVPGVPLFLPQDFWVSRSFVSNVPKTLPVAWFLFEASGEGKGQLVLSFWKDGRKIGETPGAWLDLKTIKKMYQRAYATPDSLIPPYQSSGSAFDDNSITYSPDVTPRLEPSVDEDQRCLVFVHGWKATEDDARSAGETMYKRLWWEGFNGRFATFRWPTQTSVFSYNTSEWLAWKYGKSLDDYVSKYLKNQLPSYTIAIAAHSMGNVVAGAALRRGMVLDKYMLMEAAIPSGCYNDTVNNYPRFASAEIEKGPTPDTTEQMGYRLFLAPVSGNVGKFVSFFNIDDFALVTGAIKFPLWPFETNWEKNQVDYKPNGIGFGFYSYSDGTSYFTKPKVTVRTVTDAHESLSFVARPRSKAAGAEIHNATVFGSVLNLESACDFGAGVEDHSGQFTRSIQQLKPFFKRLADELKQ